MNPFKIGLYNHDFVVEQDRIPTLLGFTAWWTNEGECAELMLQHAAAKFDGAIWVGIVNFDYCAEIFSKYAITSIPTMLILENGVPVKRCEEINAKYDVESFVLEYLGMKSEDFSHYEFKWSFYL